MGSKARQVLYVVLALLGAGLTWSNNLVWMGNNPDMTNPLAEFWVEALSSPVGASLAWDIVIAGLAGLVLVVAEQRRLGMRWWWPVLYLVLANLVAAAFALPLFLFFRERAMQRA
jgi:hypothetical protein